MNKFKKVILVGSGKGGVGKSTVSAGIAVKLAQLGYKVGLLDADIYGPSQDNLMNLKNGEINEDESKEILPTITSHGVNCVSIGSLIKDSQALAWRGPMIVSALKQMIEKTNWLDTEYLIVDLPPGTGDIVMSASKLLKVSGAVIVSTPQDMALLDAKKALDMFNKLNIPVLGLVENMSYYQCKCCNHKEYIFDNGTLEPLSKKYKCKLLGTLPLDINIRMACDEGESLAFVEDFKQIAENMLSELESLKNNHIKVEII